MEWIKSSPHKIFLIDGLGALLSAFMLGIVLVLLQHQIGLPKGILYKLAITACGFAVYSFTCYYTRVEPWTIYLKLIAVVNLLYCVWTAFLIVKYSDIVTVLGKAYFIIEIVIVVTIAMWELNVAAKGKRIINQRNRE